MAKKHKGKRGGRGGGQHHLYGQQKNAAAATTKAQSESPEDVEVEEVNVEETVKEVDDQIEGSSQKPTNEISPDAPKSADPTPVPTEVAQTQVQEELKAPTIVAKVDEQLKATQQKQRGQKREESEEKKKDEFASDAVNVDASKEGVKIENPQPPKASVAECQDEVHGRVQTEAEQLQRPPTLPPKDGNEDAVPNFATPANKKNNNNKKKNKGNQQFPQEAIEKLKEPEKQDLVKDQSVKVEEIVQVDEKKVIENKKFPEVKPDKKCDKNEELVKVAEVDKLKIAEDNKASSSDVKESVKEEVKEKVQADQKERKESPILEVLRVEEKKETQVLPQQKVKNNKKNQKSDKGKSLESESIKIVEQPSVLEVNKKEEIPAVEIVKASPKEEKVVVSQQTTSEKAKPEEKPKPEPIKTQVKPEEPLTIKAPEPIIELKVLGDPQTPNNLEVSQEKIMIPKNEAPAQKQQPQQKGSQKNRNMKGSKPRPETPIKALESDPKEEDEVPEPVLITAVNKPDPVLAAPKVEPVNVEAAKEIETPKLPEPNPQPDIVQKPQIKEELKPKCKGKGILKNKGPDPIAVQPEQVLKLDTKATNEPIMPQKEVPVKPEMTLITPQNITFAPKVELKTELPVSPILSKKDTSNLVKEFLKSDSPPPKGKCSAKLEKKHEKNAKKHNKQSKRCPYEHVTDDDPEDLPKSPMITGMLFENLSKPEKPETPVEAFPLLTQAPPKSDGIPEDPPKGAGISFAEALKIAEESMTNSMWVPPKTEEKKEDSPSESMMEDVSLSKSDSFDSETLLMESMTDSTISDLTVVVEKSLDNISNVPDEEIMKLFDIVSKEFEKTSADRKDNAKSKACENVFQEPIAQAGAALANLIEAVEKTESKIKETVEETKQRQNKAKKSKSKTPEKSPGKPHPKKDKNAADILVDAVIVENVSQEGDPGGESSTSESSRKSPSSKSSSGESKNAERSDSVQSVKVAQKQDGTKSLLKNSKSPSPPKKASTVATKNPQREIKSQETKQKPVIPPRPEVTKKASASAKKPAPVLPKGFIYPPKSQTIPGMVLDVDDDGDDEDFEDEEYVEYKFSSRKVFLSNVCHVCQVDLRGKRFPCPCQMMYYCSEKHYLEDQSNHKDLCNTIQEIAKKRGGHIYNTANSLSPADFRNLRVHTLNLCCANLKRPLQPFEKELLLFPRVCTKPECKNWKLSELSDCPKCHQISFCKAQSGHLSDTHVKWCPTFLLYQKLVTSKRLEPVMPDFTFSCPFFIKNAKLEDLLRILYRGQIKDLCTRVVLSQLATGPLTALNALQQSGKELGSTVVIHLIGAELQFEGDTLNKWESFFLHLMPDITELRVVFVGPELNVENLPVEILSRIRMCRTCRQSCRNVKFDFQCKTLYHDYVKSNAFTKPDLICYFNPGLYRMTGFSGLDTWPETIKSTLQLNCPIVVTSYTEFEAPLDFAQLEKFSSCRTKPLEIVKEPSVNPFASLRPERNFISDDVTPMIFKNYYHFVVK